MKILKYIVWGIVILLAVFYLLPAAAFQLPWVQKKISSEITAYLEEKIHTEVEIGRVLLEPFNRLIIKDIYLEDQSGDTLLEARRLAAEFELLPLLKKRIRIHSVHLFTFDFRLSRDSGDAPLNIQYLIDAFSNPDTTRTRDIIDLKVGQLNLRLGNFSFRVKDAEPTPGRFNPKDIRIGNISAKLHLEQLNEEGVVLKLSRMGFLEQSGLLVKEMTFDLKADRNSALIEKFELKLDESSLLIRDISVDYADIEGLKDLRMQLKIEPSSVRLREVATLLPALEHFEDRIIVEGYFHGTPDELKLRDLSVRNSLSRFGFQSDLLLKNILSDPDNLFIDGKISQSNFSSDGIEMLIRNFGVEIQPYVSTIRNMGDIRFKGSIHGYPAYLLSASGILDTDIGSIKADVEVGKDENRSIRGNIATNRSNFNLGALLNRSDLGELSFEAHLDARKSNRKEWEGVIDAVIAEIGYKRHRYENLRLDGEFSESHFEGLFNMDSPEGRIEAKGLFVFKGENSGFSFRAEAEKLKLDELNLTRKYRKPILSFCAEADFSGNNPDNFLGNLMVHDIDFETEKSRFELDTFLIQANNWEDEKTITVNSSLLNGKIYGAYSFRNLPKEAKQSVSLYLPSLAEMGTLPEPENRLAFQFTLEETEKLSKTLELPLTILSQSRIDGSYDGMQNRFAMEADMPLIRLFGTTLRDGMIDLKNPDDKIVLDITGTSLGDKGKEVALSAHLEALRDSVFSKLSWTDNHSRFKGDMQLDTHFSRETRRGDSELITEINIRRSEVAIHDTIWTIHPAAIEIRPSRIGVNNLRIDHGEQFLRINGAASDRPEEELAIRLNRVNLGYVFDALAIKALTFGGIATGYVTAKDLRNTREMATELDVKNFSFNNTVFGDLRLSGIWDEEDQGIGMDGWVYKNDTSTVKVKGVIYPAKEELSINFDAINTDARFLRKYLDKVIPNVTGELSGNLRLFGDLNNPTVEGNVFARNFRFYVEYLNTYYTFTDSVFCKPDGIRIKDAYLLDQYGNAARIRGEVNHRLFDDFQYSAYLDFTDFFVFNATEKDNPQIFGRAFATGNADLSGTEDVVNINVRMRNTKNTAISFNFMEESDILEYDFIHFVQPEVVDAKEKMKHSKSSLPTATSSETEIRLNMILEATPEAEIEMITDRLSGDNISGTGSGNIQIQYGTIIPLKVTGSYVLSAGKYKFSLQKAINRSFDIRENSKINFSGNPYTADLNITAAYNVTANLGDLDQDLLKQNYSARNNIPVDCILHLTGPLDRPTIGFDIDLPGATDELKRQVKSYIRTEDMMNRQLVYLLVLNRFYTSPEFASNNSDYSNNLVYLTSTLSTQVSNLLSNISDNFQIGTKFHQSYSGDEANTEIELLLSSQLLNDRLIINGNFGYIDNPYTAQGQNVPLVGDFDIEYKLTQSGDIRLRGFNHYNYRNYFSQTPEMTQGLGILFRKDFDHLSDLFRRKREKQLTVEDQDAAKAPE